MHTIALKSRDDFTEWRSAARALLLAGIPPREVRWLEPSAVPDLFGTEPPEPALIRNRAAGRVPRRFIALAKLAIRHDDADRFALLYRLLWRLQKDKGLMARLDDIDVSKLLRRAAAVQQKERNPAAAPDISPPAMAKAKDDEPSDIISLASARARVQGCTRCELYKYATQAVFGEGPAHAEIMFVGEQPGDHEDLEGRPFVGPAGKVFDAALAEAGIDRRRVYVTNAVKHFKFTPRGKRRIHNKPDRGEIDACRFWLNLERAFVKPKIIVALGTTAVTGILGKTATITSLRGDPHPLDDGAVLFATVHPSYLLRVEPEDREAETTRFTADLRSVRDYLDASAPHLRRSA